MKKTAPPALNLVGAAAFAERDPGPGPLIANVSNAVRVLRFDTKFAGHFWHDEFRQQNMTDIDGRPRELTDSDDIAICVDLQTNFGLTKLPVSVVSNALSYVASLDVRDEAKAALEQLVWDRRERLGMLMSRGFGAQDSDFTVAVGSNLLIGMIARVLQPGCKNDCCPVLEGPQGVGKSMGLQLLGGPYFSEMHTSIESKDFYLVLLAKMLIEISEMHSFQRAQVERLKGVMSCQVDRYRSPYGRRAMDHPRRSVFVATTNNDGWNLDETGARRFWPVRCSVIDLEWIRQHRDLLLAEAVAKFKAGDTWWEVPGDEARQEQDYRRPEDPWQSVVEGWLVGRSVVTTAEILREALYVDIARQDRSGQMRVANILKHLEWRRRRKPDPKSRTWQWERPE